MKVALLVTCLSFTSLISCSTLQNMLNAAQAPRGDGADVIDPYSLDTKADAQQAHAGEDSRNNMNMDSLSLDAQHSTPSYSELQNEVQMDQAPMEHSPVAEVPAMNVAPQSEMADAAQTEVAVSGPIETPAIEVFDNQSIAKEQQRAFSAPRKHSTYVEKKSVKKVAKVTKDKKGKKLAIAKKDAKKSKLVAKKSLKKEKIAKGSKAKKGMVAKSSKSKKEKLAKGKSSKETKVASSKTNKKGKKDRKVASTNN